MKKILIAPLLFTLLILPGCMQQKQQQRAEPEVSVEINEPENASVQASIEIKKNDEEVNPNEYVSDDLGFKLIVPDEWLEYGYKAEYKYTPKSEGDGYEWWEVTFSADFEDWPDYELLKIGSVPTMIWGALEIEQEALMKDAEYPLPNFPLYLKEKIGESSSHTYYSSFSRQDAPGKFIEDGNPMPDLEKDFEILE
jgi:hypothetical protein